MIKHSHHFAIKAVSFLSGCLPFLELPFRSNPFLNEPLRDSGRTFLSMLNAVVSCFPMFFKAFFRLLNLVLGVSGLQIKKRNLLEFLPLHPRSKALLIYLAPSYGLSSHIPAILLVWTVNSLKNCLLDGQNFGSCQEQNYLCLPNAGPNKDPSQNPPKTKLSSMLSSYF